MGKVLTPELGTGLFRGNFEYAGEIIPYWQSFTPTFQRIRCPAVPSGFPVNPNTCSAPYTVGGTYSGITITPIILRWNFTHGRRLMPWAQAAGGLLWTNHKYPGYGNTSPQDVPETGPSSDTSVWNFTPQGGIGSALFREAAALSGLQRECGTHFQRQSGGPQPGGECQCAVFGGLQLVEIKGVGTLRAAPLRRTEPAHV